MPFARQFHALYTVLKMLLTKIFTQNSSQKTFRACPILKLLARLLTKFTVPHSVQLLSYLTRYLPVFVQ